MTEEVICRSDSSYAERPIALRWQGRLVEVTQILARWHTPEGRRFLVKVQGDALFELFYDEHSETWRINQG